MVQRQVEQQDIHARLAQKTEETTLDVIADELTQAIFRQVAGLGNTRDLEVGSLGRDLRVEPAARRRNQIGRDWGRGVLLPELLEVRLHAIDQRLVGGSEIG